jgi:hypothetical protein
MFAYQRVGSISSILVPPNTSNGGPELDAAGPSSAYTLHGKRQESMNKKQNTDIHRYGYGSKPWYLVNPKIAGKWMFIPLKMYL